MPAALALGQIVEAKIFCLLSGQLGINVRHYSVTALPTPGPTDQDFATNLSPFLSLAYLPVLANTAQFYGVSIQIIRPIAFVAVSSASGRANGTGGAEALPPTTTGLIKIVTGLAGRRNRGRAFIPFPPEALNDLNGHPLPLYITNMNAVALDLITSRLVTGGGGSATLTPGLFHRISSTITPTIGTVVRTEWAVQKRRSLLRHSDALPF